VSVEELLDRKLQVEYVAGPCFNCYHLWTIREKDDAFNEPIECPKCHRKYYPKEVNW